MYLCCAVMECARDGAAVRDKGRGGSGAARAVVERGAERKKTQRMIRPP